MDGSTLADKYLEKGWKVIGLDTWEPTGKYPNLVNAFKSNNFVFITGDVTEYGFLFDVFNKYKPDVVYNMAAISLVPESFKIPKRVFDTNLYGHLNILEIIKHHFPSTRVYFAASSEQIGENTEHPQSTESKMLPNSPYAISKMAGYFLTRAYRKAFGIFAVNGMLWNHEGPRRGPTFVTRKITLGVARIKKGDDKTPIYLGNLDAYRDWGLSSDYCDAMIKMMESDAPDDYAVNTGEAHTVREFVEKAFLAAGTKIKWVGTGKDEKGYDENGNLVVAIDEKYYRPVEVPYLHGDHTKIKSKLGWTPTTKFDELVKMMVESDLNGN